MARGCTSALQHLADRLDCNLAFAFGAFVAAVLFWNTFGPSFVMALINQPVP